MAAKDAAEAEAGRDERLLVALRTLADDPTIRLYVAMDGALFDDLPGVLRSARLWAAPLVREGSGRDLVAAGPWMVDPNLAPVGPKADRKEADEGDLSDMSLDRRARGMAEAARALETNDDTSPFTPPGGEWSETDPAPCLEVIIRLAAGSPRVVFWCGERDLTPNRLFQHLRGLGKARLFHADGPVEGEMVLFHHANANVMAKVLPALGLVQFSRPQTDRDTGHPNEKGVGNGDHVHDWGRPSDGGPPTHLDRGFSRPPRAGDPPRP